MRKFRRHGRRIKRQRDWILAVHAVGQAQTQDDNESVGLFEILNEVDVKAHENKLTVLRIVGDFYYESNVVLNESNASLGAYAPGLMTGILKQSTIGAGEFVLPPQIGFAADAVEDLELGWLYLKMGSAGDTPVFNAHVLAPPTTATSPGELFPTQWHRHIDLKVKRRMAEHDNLIFYVNMMNASNNWAFGSTTGKLTWHWGCTLRVLVDQGGPNVAAGG